MGISPVLWQFLVKWLHSSALFPAEASTIAPYTDALYFFLVGISLVGLVFVAAFAPAEGETLGEVENGSKDSVLGTALVQYTYPAGPGGETAVEFAINPAMIREAFAADLPAETTALMAATQRPAAAAAFTDASGPPAWKRLPCWAVVATGDKAAGTDVVRAQAQRAGADIIEVEGSHVIMISQPQAVTDHILKAYQAVAASAR